MQDTFSPPADRLYTIGEEHGGLRSDRQRAVRWRRATDIVPAATALSMQVDIPTGFEQHVAEIFLAKIGEFGVRLIRREHDECPQGWVEEPKCFYRLYGRAKRLAVDALDLSDVVRNVEIDSGNALPIDGGWYAKTKRGRWIGKSPDSIRMILMHQTGLPSSQVAPLMGRESIGPWRLVRQPFRPEYPEPGKRIWNRAAPQFKFAPEPGGDDWRIDCPHWHKIYAHAAGDLDAKLKDTFGTGANYLFLWFASLVQRFGDPLPYLFLFGPENSGKSIVHEAFAEIVTGGVAKADRALTSDFNGELEHTILCVVEEKNISTSPGVYEKIKDAVTALRLSIRRMLTDTYTVENHTHWVQCANNRHACPIFDGQTRIVPMYVPPLQAEIPKDELMARLRAESPKFAWHLLNAKLPPVEGRLALPVIETETTARLQSENRHPMIQAIPMLFDTVEEVGMVEWSGTARQLADACGVEGPNDLRRVRSLLDAHRAVLEQAGIVVSHGDSRRHPIVLRK